MNTIKRYPVVGDIAILHNGKVRFLGQDATTEFVNAQQCIGVVYDVRGKEVKLVGGVNGDGSHKWAEVCQFEIKTIPSASKSCAVTLAGATNNTFQYTMTSGTMEEFVSQLNTWLTTNAPKWEAYMKGGKGYLQLSTYDVYEGSPQITDCAFDKQTGKELAFMGEYVSPRIDNKSSRQYSGMNRAKLEEFVRNEKGVNCNPANRMDGVNNLYAIFPCSEAYYNGSLGDGLRANFPTYADYLDACMCRQFDLVGPMQYRDGKALCDMMYSKMATVRGVEKPMYPAVRKACDYDSGVVGFGKGKWWLPTLYDYAIMMRHITLGTQKKPVDPINESLSKKTGWSNISAGSSRWSCCRFSFGSAWGFSGNGMSSSWGFRNAVAVSAVSALTLDFND